MITAEEVGRILGVSCEAFASNWEQAMAAQPASPEALPFLNPATVTSRRKAVGLPDEVDPVLFAMQKRVGQNPALQALGWYVNWHVFCDAPCGGLKKTMPDLTAALGDQSGVFYLLLALEFAPALTARHLAWGYPPEITAETLLQVRDSFDNHQRGLGTVGHYPGQLGWLRTFFDSPYVRLGRLSFQVLDFGGAVQVWRRRSDRAVVALLVEGTRIDHEGFIPLKDETEKWTATLRTTENGVEGFPVDPAGRAVQKLVRLDGQWECILSKGDAILAVHIPPGGRMDFASVRESYRRAVAFFATYYHDRHLRAIGCNTWFLDPRMEELVPADANPLRYQRSVYLYPVDPWRNQGLWFVFLCDMSDLSDLSKLPRDTSLRRALVDFMASGRRWNGGGCLVPIDEASDLTEGRYRESFRRLGSELFG